MKRFTKVAVLFIATITIVASTFLCAAFADEPVGANDSATYEATESTASASTVDEATLTTIEVDAYDLFTSET